MFNRIGKSCQISFNKEDILSAEKLILPGVGHFDYGIQQLKKTGLIEVLEKKVFNDKCPILGICLGAQLMTKKSEESLENGLGWIDAETIKFDKSKMPFEFKIPHMG